MKRRKAIHWASALAAALIAAGCGGSSPTSSAGGGVAVQGVVMSANASVSAADTRSTATTQASKITVRVDGTSLAVDVSASGTFVIKGIPSGTFTLVFLVDGVEIGRIEVTAADGSEVKIVVQVESSQLQVINLQVDGKDETDTTKSASCGVNGGTLGQSIELEGDVTSGSSADFMLSVQGRASFPFEVKASNASFTCVGSSKSASDCKSTVKAGAQVHVSGTLSACTTSSATVTASDVKVQKG
jgi:hypothetical protein